MTILFSGRVCGHRMPVGVERCRFCFPPKLDATPLRNALHMRSLVDGPVKLSFDIAHRLSLEPASVERQIRRILTGEWKRIGFWVADRLANAINVWPIELWGDEWMAASPMEPFGDEDF